MNPELQERKKKLKELLAKAKNLSDRKKGRDTNINVSKIKHLEDELRREKIKTLKLEFDVRRLEDIIEDKASIVHNMTTDISSIEAENQSLRNSLQNYISNNMKLMSLLQGKEFMMTRIGDYLKDIQDKHATGLPKINADFGDLKKIDQSLLFECITKRITNIFCYISKLEHSSRAATKGAKLSPRINEATKKRYHSLGAKEGRRQLELHVTPKEGEELGEVRIRRFNVNQDMISPNNDHENYNNRRLEGKRSETGEDLGILSDERFREVLSSAAVVTTDRKAKSMNLNFQKCVEDNRCVNCDTSLGIFLSNKYNCYFCPKIYCKSCKNALKRARVCKHCFERLWTDNIRNIISMKGQ